MREPTISWDGDTHLFHYLPKMGQLLDDGDPAPELPSLEKLEVLKDALGLVAELWPVPGSATVHLETHQWVKLRRVLLAIPDLVAEDES